MRNLSFIALLLATLTFGCYQYSSRDSDPRAPQVVLAKAFFENLRNDNLDFATSRLNPAQFGPDLPRTLQAMSALFPKETPLDVKTIGNFVDIHYETVVGTGTTEKWNAMVTFQYEFENAWLLAGATLSRQADGIVIDGVKVVPIEGPLDKINGFSFEHKSFTHYAVLTAACAVAIFILATLVICFKTPLRKRKWLWLLFIAFGAGQLALNWTTGDITWNAVNIQMFGAGFVKPSPFAPTYVFTSFPLGAVIF